MNQLLSTAHIDDARLKSILSRIQGELLKLSKNGYCPNLEKSKLDLIRASGLTKQDIDDFSERIWKGRPEERRRYPPDQFTLFLVWLMWYCLNQNDVPGFRSALIYHMVRQYRTLFRFKYFKEFCNPDRFSSALDALGKSHLFSRKGSIPNAISYLSNALAKKYEQGIKDRDLNAISKFITESRSRLNQSLKTLANFYYEQRIASDEERDDHAGSFSLNTPDQLVSDITYQICGKGYIDQEAISEAKKITKISDSMATALVHELSNGTTPFEYSEDVRLILELFSNGLSSTEICQFRTFIKHLNRLIRVKKTTKPVYFKKEVVDLTTALVKNSGRKQEFLSLTPQTRSRICQFLAYYITTVLRNTVLQLGRAPTLLNGQES
jgi:hypothetical protein